MLNLISGRNFIEITACTRGNVKVETIKVSAPSCATALRRQPLQGQRPRQQHDPVRPMPAAKYSGGLGVTRSASTWCHLGCLLPAACACIRCQAGGQQRQLLGRSHRSHSCLKRSLNGVQLVFRFSVLERLTEKVVHHYQRPHFAPARSVKA